MMNDQPPGEPAELFTQRLLSQVREFAFKEPTKAVAAAFGVGLLINLLPTRVLAGAAAAVASTLVRPTLLSLGVIKAVELCCPPTPKLNHP
jgi:hypothetical protein